MPTSIESFRTYIPQYYQTNTNQNKIPVKQQIPLKSNRFKYSLGISVSVLILLISCSILIPLLIGQSQLSPSKTSSSNNIVELKWNSRGVTVAGVSGQGGTNANQLRRPFGLRMDSKNNLYVADAANHRIQKFSMNSSIGQTVGGQSNGSLGSGNSFLRYCSDVVVDQYQSIYIADILNYRIQLWLNGSTTGSTLFPVGNDSLGTPYGLTFDSSTNRLFISDTSNHRIISFQIGSSMGSIVAGGNGNGTNSNQLSRPNGIYFDSSTNSLFIANTGANNIVQWIVGQSNWRLIVGNVNGTSGSSNKELNLPSDVFLDSSSNIYVADTSNHRIQFFYSGQINGTTIAGSTTQSGDNATLLNLPRSILLDSQKNLYVSDTENHRIQLFTSIP